MLDEAEFASVEIVYGRAMQATKDYREEFGLPLESISMEERFSPVCSIYNQMTGFHETCANAIMHHRISLYGPPCPACDKPFRTPKASFCAECGYRPTQAGQGGGGNSAALRASP